MTSVLGLDVGGTKIALTRYDHDSYEPEATETIPTSDKGIEFVLDDIVGLIQHHRRSDTIGVGIGLPGAVQQPEGILLRAPNIPGSTNVEVRKIVTTRTGLLIHVHNDACCFALAEATVGAGKGHPVVVGVVMGTGVGGGIVIDGRIYQGSHSFGGGIGHMLLKPGEPPFDTEDKRGDVEQFISGKSMGLRRPDITNPEEYLKSDLRDDIIREVAWMCASLTHVIDPSIFIFGGAAGKALEPHLDAIKLELGKWVLPGTPLPELAIAKLDEPGTLGAALLAV